MDKVITKKEVEEKLITSLLEKVSNKGFIFRKKDKRIIRKTENGFEAFSFVILNYWPYCEEIDWVGYSIRLNKIEDIINPIMAKHDLYNMEFAKTSTTISQWWRPNIQVFSDEDVNKFLRDNLDKIEEDGLSFFSRHNDFSSVNLIEKERILCNYNNVYNTSVPIMSSLILMKLCNDNDFDELKIRYRQILLPRHGLEKRDFAAYDDLVNYLSQ